MACQLLRDGAEFGLCEFEFEVVEEIRVCLVNKSDCSSGLARTTGSADSVNVGLNVVGHGKVDDETDVGDVDTTTSQIRCHQDLRRAVPKMRKRLFSQLLRLTRVQRRNVKPCPNQ